MKNPGTCACTCAGAVTFAGVWERRLRAGRRHAGRSGRADRRERVRCDNPAPRPRLTGA